MAILANSESHLQLLFTVMGIRHLCQDTDLLSSLMAISGGICSLLPKVMEAICSNRINRLELGSDIYSVKN